jgi:hypothetical protein
MYSGHNDAQLVDVVAERGLNAETGPFRRANHEHFSHEQVLP